MKTFDDLEFGPHPAFDEEVYRLLGEKHPKAERAFMEFPNGYAVSVLRGGPFYTTNGTYELAVMKDGQVVYDTPITDDVLGHISKWEVTEAMRKVQEL